MIESLPRREREIFEILCSLGEGSAAEVRRAMSHAPSDSAVRALLARLVSRGMISHRSQGQSYVYAPVPEPERMAETALQRIVHTFFQGSVANAANALLGMSPNMTQIEIDALQRMIDRLKEEGK